MRKLDQYIRQSRTLFNEKLKRDNQEDRFVGYQGRAEYLRRFIDYLRSEVSTHQEPALKIAVLKIVMIYYNFSSFLLQLASMTGERSQVSLQEEKEISDAREAVNQELSNLFQDHEVNQAMELLDDSLDFSEILWLEGEVDNLRQLEYMISYVIKALLRSEKKIINYLEFCLKKSRDLSWQVASSMLDQIIKYLLYYDATYQSKSNLLPDNFGSSEQHNLLNRFRLEKQSLQNKNEQEVLSIDDTNVYLENMNRNLMWLKLRHSSSKEAI
jgi:hypothetical protein